MVGNKCNAIIMSIRLQHKVNDQNFTGPDRYRPVMLGSYMQLILNNILIIEGIF